MILLYRSCLRLFPFLILLATLTSILHAQALPDPSGRWEGSIQVPGQPLEVRVKLAGGAGAEWTGQIDIPMQGAKDLPLTGIVVDGARVAFAIKGIPGDPTFKGELAGDGLTMAGTMTQGGGAFPFSLKKMVQEPQTGKDLLAELRSSIPEQMKEWNVPGLSIAIVRDGEVIFSEGFGYRDVEKQLPVTPNTLFAIGSTTKAFTGLVLATLVDEEKLDWNTPVVDYLPNFKLKDEYATAHMTPRDLLLHISGLPRHDAMWYGTSLTRREMFDRLRYLEPNADFRSRWQYQNLMYMTAGYLAGEVSGKRWEDLVWERIFAPLGMTNSNFSVKEMERSADAALPYNEEKKKIVKMPYRAIDEVGPAGSINSSAADMAKWVKLQLSNGTVDEIKVIEPASLKELHRGRVVINGGAPSFKELLFNLYAAGWMVRSFHGRRLLHHGGSIDGFSAIVSFMPEDGIGIVILSNLNGTDLPNALMLSAYEKLLGLPEADWNKRFKGSPEDEEEEKEEFVDKIPGTRPSHPLKDYVGEYEHPAYGTILVEMERDRLKMTYNTVSSRLEHYHYETFTAPDLPASASGMKILFHVDVNGGIGSLSLPLETSVPNMVFTRRGPAALSDTALLDRYTGEYIMEGATITVSRTGGELRLTVPSQPRYHLNPYREGEFRLGLKQGSTSRFDPMEGYSIRFDDVKNGKAEKAVFVQPNGVFVAKRK